MDRGAWRTTVHRLQSQTGLKRLSMQTIKHPSIPTLHVYKCHSSETRWLPSWSAYCLSRKILSPLFSLTHFTVCSSPQMWDNSKTQIQCKVFYYYFSVLSGNKQIGSKRKLINPDFKAIMPLVCALEIQQDDAIPQGPVLVKSHANDFILHSAQRTLRKKPSTLTSFSVLRVMNHMCRQLHCL